MTSASRKALVRCVMEVSLLCTAFCASHIFNEAVAPVLHRVVAACVTGAKEQGDWKCAVTSRTVVCSQLNERAVTGTMRHLDEELCPWRVVCACLRVRRLVLYFCTLVDKGTSTVRNVETNRPATQR